MPADSAGGAGLSAMGICAVLLAFPHAALANAWQLLGYDSNAREEAKKAVELSTNLSQQDRRSIEGRYRELTSEWDKAIEIYRSLWGVFQDEPNYALELAKVQTAAGKGQDALATLVDLQHQPQLVDDPRIDLARRQQQRRKHDAVFADDDHPVARPDRI